MSLLMVLLVIWSVVTAALILLLIYRSVVSMKEEDQLFLSPAEGALQREQQEILRKLNKLDPYVKFLGIASGALLLLVIGVWIYQGLTKVG